MKNYTETITHLNKKSSCDDGPKLCMNILSQKIIFLSCRREWKDEFINYAAYAAQTSQIIIYICAQKLGIWKILIFCSTIARTRIGAI